MNPKAKSLPRKSPCGPLLSKEVSSVTPRVSYQSDVKIKHHYSPKHIRFNNFKKGATYQTFFFNMHF